MFERAFTRPSRPGNVPGQRTARRAWVVVAMTAAALVASTPSAQAMSPDSTVAPSVAVSTGRFTFDSLTPARYESRMKHWMNVARENNGAKSLGVNSCVDGFAESWTKHLAKTDSFYHQDLGPIMRECSVSSAAEILALGPVWPRRMIQMFMDSPAHRQIMLSRDYAFTGISATKKKDGAWVGAIELDRH